ncbi:helix-turn-helix domain-containing protein [Dactylosporangium vinaceum]|uniref:Helix-turn-helix domain-containing protein n=1 Tax=Dactylosporangium vinaceum TaxID=53362 RepID=A0ABV5MPN7_9ACTN|nr:helix-turn-helix domain-containing protein [Dactylosporangium vinaceum]UAB96713.1 helix-turn-helix domain-containing protein [Dactylosporangium vinaceum]
MSPVADHDPRNAGASFAGALRARRLARGLTQDELAARAGLGVRTLRELERGRVARPQRTTLSLLADALSLTGPDREAFLDSAANRPALPDPRSANTRYLDTAGRMVRGRGALRREQPAPPEPRPAPSGTARTALPLPTTPPLIGRDADVAELLTLYSTQLTQPAGDVVALIGMAGVGKSALAHAVAHSAVAAGWTAVSVTVMNISQTTDIFSAVAAVFGVARADELSQTQEPVLLVVDGADRAPRAAIEAITWLRARAPAVRMLVTSRRPLAGELPGVVDWQVQPLEVPAGRRLDAGSLRRVPAVALFVERLRAVRREPARDEELPTIAELVRRLDGLPLAIELAAARGRVLELVELLSRYQHRILDLAATDPPGRRLRDVVADSYQLLAGHEQAALRRLSTFRGKWSVELAELLLDGVVDDVEAVLDRLVGLGLVSVRGPGDMRFRLLDVVFDFAAERCADAGELRAARLRHAEVVMRTATRVSAELTGPGSAAATLRLDYLNGDIRTALRYTAVREPEIALRIAGAIPRWCRLRGRDVEGYRLLRRLLDDRRTQTCDPAIRAWAQVGAAMLATAHGRGAQELCATEAALLVLVERGDVTGELTARALLAGIWQALGGSDEAHRHNEAALGLAVRTGRGREIAVTQNNLAWHDVLVGDLGMAARRLEGAGRRAAEARDARLCALTEANLAEVARLDGRFGTAIALARRAATVIAEVGDPSHRVRVLGTLGQAFAETGQPGEASAVLAELAAVPGSAGTVALINGYLALARGARPAAAKAFESAANLLAGRDDIRDVLEALVGLVVSADPPTRSRALEDLAGLRERGRIRLLPREHRLLAPLADAELANFGGTDEDPLGALSRRPT